MGFSFSKTFVNRLDYVRKIHKMLFEIKNLIQFRELKIYEIFNRLNYKLDFLSFEKNGNFLENWEESVNADKNLLDKERQLLLSFGRELGTTDTEGQVAILDLYIKYFETLIGELSESVPKKTKSYKAVGVFAASIIFIISV
jgi:stage III sporulation protein AB